MATPGHPRAPGPAVKPKLVAYEHHAELVARCARAEERCALLAAELEGVEAGLAALVTVVRSIGSYLPPAHQQCVWAAQAWLAGRPRSVPR